MRLFPICCLVILLSCTKETHQKNKFSDPAFVRTAEWQDRRITDSLIQYLDNPEVRYRQMAALALGSVQDTIAVPSLGQVLLKDSDSTTRSNAAFALGQTGGSLSAQLLYEAFTKELNRQVLNQILESLGKTIHAQSMDTLFSAPTELSESDIGKAWFYYRFGLRHPFDNVTPVAEYLADSYAEETRLGASHFFARSRNKSAKEAAEVLIQCALNDSSEDVRMAAAAGLRKLDDPSVVQTIKQIMKEDKDYRVRINALRSLSDFPFELTKDILTEALDDSMVNVSITSAEVIRSSITPSFQDNIVTQAQRATNWRVQALLYDAVLSVGNQEEIIQEVRTLCKSSAKPYQKAVLLQALGNSVSSHPFVRQQLLETSAPVVRSSAAMALVAMNRHKDFPSSLRNIFRDYFIEAIATEDVAVIGIITDALMDSSLQYKSLISNTDFLYEAKKKLSLPGDYESFVPLEKAIAYFENREAEPVKKDFNNPIDWMLVKRITANQQAIIKTTKGEIIIRLLVEEAPGSVANFVELVQKNYFNAKFIHRVVPNFVIQGGCNRGDGWGSEDYSIRSEFSSRKYTTGSVGMASAGKDTEGTQWFITHSPTPHLDGRYTIFAEVEKGMDVVHRIEVGDSIVSVTLFPELSDE